MPSLRVLSVVILVGLGAAVAAVGGIGESDEPGSRAVRGLTAGLDASATGAVLNLTGTLSVGTSVTTGAAFDVRAENKRPGTPGWRISQPRGTKQGLAAYAGVVSVLPGQSVPLSVNGDGPVRIRALRIGWYGGVGARQVWEGTLQAEPEAADPSEWAPRGLVDTTGWPEGHYLLRLDLGDASRYLPLTVRSADNSGRIVVLTSPMTWVAENLTTTSATTPPKLSFNRPYATGYGSADFLQNDAGIIQLAERTGRRIGFVTDYDVATNPALLKAAAAVLTGGNSQYWTASLRTAIRAAGNAGTNLAFFGAGTGARKVFLVDKGRAMQISSAKPATSVRITGLRPSCLVGPPGTPESSKTVSTESGSGSAGGSGATSTGWVVTNANWWGYEGTGVKTDDVLPRLVSDRVDRASTTSDGSPKPMQVLSSTRVPCGSGAGSVAQSGVYLVRPSGAGIFAAGTGRWACAVADACTNRSGKAVKFDKDTTRVVTRVTRNVINAFAKDQAGKRLTALDTASQYEALR